MRPLRPRWRSASLAIAAVLATAPAAASAGTITADGLGYPDVGMPCEHAPYNVVGPCAHYDWGPTHTETSDDPSELSPRGYAYRNCTDYVAWRLQGLGVSPSAFQGLGNGGQWAANAASRPGLRVSFTPKAGMAAVVPSRNPQDFGHVAYVRSVNVDGTITVEEYNYDQKGGGDVWTGLPRERGFTRFVDFGVDTAPPSPPVAPSARAFGSQPTVTVHWGRSTDDRAVTGYEVLVNGSVAATVTGTLAQVSGLTCGLSYSVAVRAFDAAGNRSGIATASPVLLDACLRSQARGKIVSVANGPSYYYDGRGLHWIPDVQTYYCLVDKPIAVYTVGSQAQANLLGNGQPWVSPCLSLGRVLGSIIREQSSGASYTVSPGNGSRGVWHWIPTGGVYNCLARRMPVIQSNWTQINSLRGPNGQYEGAHATC